MYFVDFWFSDPAQAIRAIKLKNKPAKNQEDELYPFAFCKIRTKKADIIPTFRNTKRNKKKSLFPLI